MARPTKILKRIKVPKKTAAPTAVTKSEPTYSNTGDLPVLENDLPVTDIPNLRSVLRGMIAGLDLAEKYGEPKPALPDNIVIKQSIVKLRPCLRNNYQ